MLTFRATASAVQHLGAHLILHFISASSLIIFLSHDLTLGPIYTHHWIKSKENLWLRCHLNLMLLKQGLG